MVDKTFGFEPERQEMNLLGKLGILISLVYVPRQLNSSTNGNGRNYQFCRYFTDHSTGHRGHREQCSNV